MSEQTLKTSYDDDPIMFGFFMGCVRWALVEKRVMDEHRKQTGDKFSPASTAEARMIDHATGADIAFLQRFSDWVEENLFGSPDQIFGDDA
ncbi:hypothetical protein N7376_17400 [Brucella intermedia GD04153]|uniref:Uncharacterized protein n=1 Tax=Brucella intermedia GD04153 TaxID=2975438 RepID=A0AA42H962_9HYPH|nr:hypothetical protein [Brucella intermedia]MDH0125781.1 hypothetical protein [Brucella intermedia GD04153]